MGFITSMRASALVACLAWLLLPESAQAVQKWPHVVGDLQGREEARRKPHGGRWPHWGHRPHRGHNPPWGKRPRPPPWGKPKPPHGPPHGPHPEEGYKLTKHYNAENMLDHFKFMTAADFQRLVNANDPTNGYVNYVDRKTAEENGYVDVINGDQLYIGADHWKVLNSSDIGRDSIRLESRQSWSSGLLIADFAHMPGNQCGLWPAFWTYNMQEDPIGEVDIIEGTSYQEANIVSVHTGEKCRFTPGWQTGTEQRPDCRLFDITTNTTNWDGCGMTATRPYTYGSDFNKVGGGVYATQIEDQAIKIWHWTRREVPKDIIEGKPRPEQWGQPMGNMNQEHGGCNVHENFHTQTIIINIDFCGDNFPQDAWEGDEICNKHPTCNGFVAKNPEAFFEAYWLINSIKVYQKPGQEDEDTPEEPDGDEGEDEDQPAEQPGPPAKNGGHEKPEGKGKDKDGGKWGGPGKGKDHGEDKGRGKGRESGEHKNPGKNNDEGKDKNRGKGKDDGKMTGGKGKDGDKPGGKGKYGEKKGETKDKDKDRNRPSQPGTGSHGKSPWGTKRGWHGRPSGHGRHH